jgi:hypothetical protein
LLSKNIKIKTYRTIVLPVVLIGRETWSLTYEGETQADLVGNRVFRRIFEPKRDVVTGDWRRLLSEQLNNLHSSPNINRVIRSRRM